MNKKGFTLVELLATIIILSLIAGIAIVTLVSSFKKAKEDTENVFIRNLEDAIEIYLDSIVSNDQKTSFDTTSSICKISKRFGDSSVHPATNTIKLSSLTNNPYSPLGEFVNPANESNCNTNATIRIYRDSEYVYYYFIEKQNLDCLLDKTGYITNLPCECINENLGANASLVPRCR